MISNIFDISPDKTRQINNITMPARHHLSSTLCSGESGQATSNGIHNTLSIYTVRTVSSARH